MKNTPLSICMMVCFSAAVCMLLPSCHKRPQVVSTESRIIAINADLDEISDSAYIQSLLPLQQELKEKMGEQIGYCTMPMIVQLPESPMINWTADALLYEAQKHYNGTVDCAIVNVGGIRCDWEEGPITIGSVYELMPFDNQLCVLTLTGEDMLELCQVFVAVGGEGVAGIRVQAEDGQLIDAQIGGTSIVPEAIYHVATSDYLSTGKDKMTSLANYSDYWAPNLLIRDLYIDYVKEQKIVCANIDNRMSL